MPRNLNRQGRQGSPRKCEEGVNHDDTTDTTEEKLVERSKGLARLMRFLFVVLVVSSWFQLCIPWRTLASLAVQFLVFNRTKENRRCRNIWISMNNG